jgi:hypothetical protein
LEHIDILFFSVLFSNRYPGQRGAVKMSIDVTPVANIPFTVTDGSQYFEAYTCYRDGKIGTSTCQIVTNEPFSYNAVYFSLQAKTTVPIGGPYRICIGTTDITVAPQQM